MADHVPVSLRFTTVRTRDLAKARGFYEEALGLRLTREHPEYVQLDAGGTQLCLDLAAGEAAEAEDEPVLIFATDDLAGLREQLAGYGYPPMSGFQSSRAFMVRDPDGVPVVFEAAGEP